MSGASADEGVSLACVSRMHGPAHFAWALPLNHRCPYCLSERLRLAGALLSHPQQALVQCLDCAHVFTLDLASLQQVPLH
jgi:hypothetical protein